MIESKLEKLALQERTRREILHRSDLIPPLPDVVVRVIALLNQRDIEPKDLEQHLQCDQVLVAKILGLVNSPFYGMNRQIASIRDAVMVLGFRGLRSLILASSTADYLMSDFSSYGHSPKGLWEHSLAVASGAKTLGGIIGLDQETREEMFVAGLLHDIGKMLVCPYLLKRKIILGSNPDLTIQVESDTIGIDHAEAGALVAAKWRLSTMVQELLRCHHGTGEVPGELETHLAVLNIANAMAHEGMYGYRNGSCPSTTISVEDHALIEASGTDWVETKTQVQAGMEAALAGLNSICS